MEIKLHANARTTPKTREYIYNSSKTVKELSAELGLSEVTVRKWRNRTDRLDRSHTRHNLHQSTTPVEEEMIVELSERLSLSIKDIAEVMHRCINKSLSCSAIARCLRRCGAVKGRKNPNATTCENTGRTYQTFESQPFGFVHIDLKQLTKLQSKISYVFVAIERNTRYVWVDIIPDRKMQTIAHCLRNFIEQCGYKDMIHTIMTDNGSEFTDRFAKGKKDGRPTGNHEFDRICWQHNICHKLTRPYSPQTNGKVERFNRRLADAFRQKPIHNPNNSRTNHFADHAERNQFVRQFVDNYNLTRLQCTEYQTPLQLLNNHTELNITRSSGGSSDRHPTPTQKFHAYIPNPNTDISCLLVEPPRHSPLRSACHPSVEGNFPFQSMCNTIIAIYFGKLRELRGL